MSAGDLILRERAALRELRRLAADRASEEESLEEQHRQAQAAAAADREARVVELNENYRAETASAEHEFVTRQQQLVARFDAERQQLEESTQVAYERLARELNQGEKQAEQALTEARWLAQSVYEADRKRRKQQFEEVRLQLQARLDAVLTHQRDAMAYLDHLGVPPIAVEQSPLDEPDASAAADWVNEMNQAIGECEVHLHELRSHRLLSAMHGSGAIGAFLLPLLLIVPALGFLAGWNRIGLLIAASVLAAALGVGLVYGLRRVARQQAQISFEALIHKVRKVERYFQRCLDRTKAVYKHQQVEAKAARDAEEIKAVEKHNPALQAFRQRREQDLPRIASDAKARFAQLKEQRETELSELSRRHTERSVNARARYEQTRADLRFAAEQKLAAQQAAYTQRKNTFLADWQRRFNSAKLELTAIRREIEKSCPDWKSRAWYDWQPPEELARAVSFGRMSLDLRGQLGEAATSSEFAGQSLEFSLPAMIGFPQQASLFIRAQDKGSRFAVELLQVAVLRLLTTVPPGKLRMTFIDPVGLGQNFSAFMHLADFDEALVSHRIWTEPHQIEQRLGDLTAHMETVIQKYLRSEFATIEEYNARAGEIAEPFRLLVIANFPTGFTENAARRLASIIAAGPRCGVYTLLSADAGATLPGGLKPADLQVGANIFSATSDGLTWRDPDFESLPLAVDDFPTAEWCKNILQIIGSAAVKAKRVEVPFEAIAPPPERYWTGDTRAGIDVPLGRAGATQLQHLRLGHGTSQHVLIAGKTGSGKSTLLHALIVNAALRYSPDELELYLIDFKKGVEFKTYVTHELPHARVVAIESEREFGLSVMQRLDAEMNARGERFRELGVQDIAGFRNAGGQLPRILLLVDEFQEFFVSDDKLSQDASLLLDRLVRQGRAFGIHVHLGSQTLGGAYSLARSTLGQMAIRIALQCSEADANLILSEDNAAARLLSRPGEAIYNDANGMVEGNHPFQIVWLSDDRREEYLRRIHELAEQRPPLSHERQIVFEGMQPADLARNVEIAELLASPVPSEPPRLPRVWLGEPLAIQSATATSFQRRSGSNVLWIGLNDEAVAGMLLSTLASLLLQLPPPAETTSDSGQQLFVLDGGTLDGPQAAPFRRLAAALPTRVRLAGLFESAAVIADLAAELERRQADVAGAVQPPLFLCVYDLSRFRELRRKEDDFGFSGFGGQESAPAAKPDKQFAELLREGPAYGIHLLVWCDTLTNFNRTLDRQGMREFDTRVLLQMSAADSSMLIDVAAASQLGRRRALLHREDEGKLEKFRPFAVPAEEWLDWFVAQLGERPRSDSQPAGQTGASR